MSRDIEALRKKLERIADEMFADISTEKEATLLPLADEIVRARSVGSIPLVVQNLLASWLCQTKPYTDAVMQEVTIAQTRPSARPHQTSVFMECIVDSIFATLPVSKRGLPILGLFFTEILSAQLDFAVHSFGETGSIVTLPSAAFSVLSAMNYHVIKAALAKAQREADHHRACLLRLVWYLRLGGGDRLLGTIRDFNKAMQALKFKPDTSVDTNTFSTSAVFAEHQIRFLIAHEISHIVRRHTDIPVSELWKEVQKVSVSVLHGGVYDLMSPTIPPSQIPPEIFERLASANPTATVNKIQSCELEADQMAVALCTNEHDQALQRLPEFATGSRRPDFVEWVWRKQLFCEHGQSFFADASTLLLVYLTLMGYASDMLLMVRELDDSKFQAPKAAETHPRPELRLDCLRRYHHLNKLGTEFSNTIEFLTSRGNFWEAHRSLSIDSV